MSRKCCGTLSRELGTCLRNGAIEVDGKWYCFQHDPARAEEKARIRRAEREAHEAAMEAEWKRKAAHRRLMELIREADDLGGRVHIKPAGQKAELRFCIPDDIWMQVRQTLAEIDDEESGTDGFSEINPYDRSGIDE